MHPATVYVSGAGFLLGVALASHTDVGVPAFLFVFLLACAVAVGAAVNEAFCGGVSAYRTIGVTVALALFMMTLGIGRMILVENTTKNDPLSPYIEHDITLRGVVSSEADIRDQWQWVTIAPDSLNVRGETHDVSEAPRVRAALRHFPSVSYGETVRVSGTLESPKNFETETGRTFNYVGYLAADNIGYLMWYPDVSASGERGGNPVVSGLLTLKHSFKGMLQRMLPEPEAALANGILLGYKQALGETSEERFRDTGIIHIVVLSGFNVTIVAIFIMWCFSFLPKNAARIAAIISIGLFAVLVGLGATVVRASFMAVLALFAPLIHRRYSIHRALLCAAVAMVAINPYVLVFDPSFQLSFVATLGLVYIGPIVQRGFQFLPAFVGFRDVVVATLSAQIAVVPLLFYVMGEVSVVSPIVNLLVLPIIPLAMLVAFITGLAGFVISVLASLLTVPTYLVLTYVFRVVEVFAALPFATISAPPFPFWVVGVVYVVLAGVVVWWWRKYKPEVEVFSSVARLQ